MMAIPAPRKTLSIGMATYDYDGVYFSVISIRLHHPKSPLTPKSSSSTTILTGPPLPL